MPPRNKPQKVRLCQLPGSGVGQMRNGRSEQRAQEKKIERDAGDEARRENQIGEGQIDHGARAKKQIRFADLRQRADDSVSVIEPV